MSKSKKINMNVDIWDISRRRKNTWGPAACENSPASEWERSFFENAFEKNIKTSLQSKDWQVQRVAIHWLCRFGKDLCFYDIDIADELILSLQILNGLLENEQVQQCMSDHNEHAAFNNCLHSQISEIETLKDLYEHT